MSFTKLQQEHEALRNEYHICRRKLDSKCEALLILSQDLDQCRQGRDQFKLMAEQVQARYQAMKRQLAGVGPRTTSFDGMEFADMKQKNLAQLLCDMREVNKSQQLEIDDLKQKLSDAQGDIRILREQIARQRVGTTDEGINTRHFPAHEREDLVRQLEEAREQFVQIERDLQQVLDEKEELVTERDVYKNKYDRLNTELNFILKGDEKRIVDIDALSMENKYLQDRLKQMEEEKTMAMATVSKYKSILERKKNKGILRLGQSRSGGVVISQKQVQQLLENKSMMTPTPKMMSDLQSLASALLETLNDKNLALSHQRKTNKILGTRVAELENKLKTLEVAGLWNVPDPKAASSLEKLRQEVAEIQTLIPTSPSDSTQGTAKSYLCDQSDITQGTVPAKSYLCDLTEQSDKVSVSQSDNGRPFSLALEDLDLLPTKERSVDLSEFEGQSEDLSEISSQSAGGLLDPTDYCQQCQADICDSEVTEDSIESNLDSAENFTENGDDEELEEDADYQTQQLSALLDRATAKVIGENPKDSDLLGQSREVSSTPSTPRCTSPLLEDEEEDESLTTQHTL